MVKTEKNNETIRDIQAVSQASPCGDCIFWYRCRGGKIDCLFKTPMNISESVRA